VVSDELPDDGQNQLFVSILNIRSSDSNSGYLHCLGSIEGDLAVDSSLKVVVRVLFDSFPLD